MLDYTQLLVLDAKSTIWQKVADRPTGEKEELIAIDIAVIDTIKQEIIEREDILIRPENSKVSEYCFQQYGISQNQLDKDGVSFEDAYRRLRVHFMSLDRIWCIWGHNTAILLNHTVRTKNMERLFNTSALDMSHVFSMLSGKTIEGETPTLYEAYEHCGLKMHEINSAVAIGKLILRMGNGIRSPHLSQSNKQRNFFNRGGN